MRKWHPSHYQTGDTAKPVFDKNLVFVEDLKRGRNNFPRSVIILHQHAK
jgi:hypothetical protein